MDPEKRRRYDSILEFNDSIPELFDAAKQDFFEVFAPVFRRNAYFSKTQPVPPLGGTGLEIKAVLAFYEFWENFDSWRDFTHEEEYDLA